jgi:hypothetical protein
MPEYMLTLSLLNNEWVKWAKIRSLSENMRDYHKKICFFPFNVSSRWNKISNATCFFKKIIFFSFIYESSKLIESTRLLSNKYAFTIAVFIKVNDKYAKAKINIISVRIIASNEYSTLSINIISKIHIKKIIALSFVFKIKLQEKTN